jgi:hypothetical protein
VSGQLFVEHQYIRRSLLFPVFGICLVVIVWLAYQAYRQLVFGIPMGNHPVPDWLLGPFMFGVSLFMMGIPALLAVCHLSVEVKDDVLTVRYWPFSNRRIPLSEIASCEVRTYRPIREYGGWGVRYSWANGMAYNVSGNRGVQLVLRDGRHVLIGSREPDELLAALRTRE